MEASTITLSRSPSMSLSSNDVDFKNCKKYQARTYRELEELHNFMKLDMPYKDLLMFHGVGTGMIAGL